MWRLTVLLFGMTLCAQQIASEAILLAFNNHYEIFFKHYFGCAPDVTAMSQCRPGSGTLDLKEQKASCEAAKKLFGLQGKC